ncbi:MAG: hypothetical protein OEY33_03065 [Bdellovibrionales bacterium]|nr:hypothetical protein [Bdellovibrionales bacterium]
MSKVFLIILFSFSTSTFAGSAFPGWTFKGMMKKQWDEANEKYGVKKRFDEQECAYVKNRVDDDKEWGYICTNDIILIIEFPSNYASARGEAVTNEYFARVTEVIPVSYYDGGVKFKVRYSNANGCSTRVTGRMRQPLGVDDKKSVELKSSYSRFITPLPMYFKEDWKNIKAWADRCGGGYPGANPFYLKYEKNHYEEFIDEYRYY